MKKKISKNEKLVLKKDTITRLTTIQMKHVNGGIWTTIKTSWNTTSGGSSGSQDVNNCASFYVDQCG